MIYNSLLFLVSQMRINPNLALNGYEYEENNIVTGCRYEMGCER